MKKLIIALSLSTLVAGCDTPGQTAALGAATGAAIGAATAGKNETKGAIIGAAAGLATGAIIGGANQPGMCRYRYPDGTEYTAECPS